MASPKDEPRLHLLWPDAWPDVAQGPALRMIKTIDQTTRFLWAWAFNRTVTWVDPETGCTETEVYGRQDFWLVFRPHWFRTIFTTNPGCGCRRRFGIWQTMWCHDHVMAMFGFEDET